MKKQKARRIQPDRNSHRKNATRADPAMVEAVMAAARSDLLAFIQICFHILSPSKPLLMNWHIKAIAHQLEQVRLGRQKRIIISVPPRHLKSIITSVIFPAFILGCDASKSIIVASYGAALAVKHGNDFRRIIDSTIYRMIFPNVIVMKSTEVEVTTTEGGCRIATSVDGPTTGRGCDYAIIDDPLKPGDALSDTKRERTNDWFYQTLLSRLNDPRSASMILVMQRLHQNDLAGTLRRSSEEWFYLSIPAIATRTEVITIGPNTYYEREEGTPLHAERMSLDELQNRREEVGSDTWAAQYQQEPVPPGGAMVKRAWVGRYEVLPVNLRSRIIQSVDTAIKAGPQNDYSVITTWMLSDNCYYLIDVARKRLEYPELKAFVLERAKKYQPAKILIEDAGTGSALIQDMRLFPYAVVGVRPKVDKETRMLIAAAKFESGKVLFPQSAAWLAELETELFSFPQSRHDDQIDSISQALTEEVSYYDPGSIADGLSNIFFATPRWNVIW